MALIRLQKYLAECGIGSRRTIEKLITEQRIVVNGVPATLGQKVDPESDQIYVDNQPITPNLPQKIYILLNKPANVVTTTKDELGRTTVIDLLQNIPSRVFPVGRLDMDVEGALILTNDGELANKLLHPRYQIPKTYIATLKGFITTTAIKQLQTGVILEDGKTVPAHVKVIRQELKFSTIKLTIHEGKKREIKRMCEAVGFPVIHLKRISFAGIHLGSLKPGEWRYLTPEEISHLKQLTNPPSQNS